MKKSLSLIVAVCCLALMTAQSHAAFVVAVDLDPVDGPQSLNPNFSFGGDTTAASDSTQSFAVGMPAHQSLFGGNGVNFGDTYVVSYTPGTDADNYFPSSGDLLGSVTGFGTETASGVTGGASGTYKVYVTVPSSTNVSAFSNFTVTGDGAPVVLSSVNLNDGGTGADLDAGPAFVGGANNAWFLLGTVDLTAGVTYTVTQDATANTFVSQRLAGVMWELQSSGIPEPTSVTLLTLGGVALFGLRRRQ